MRPTLAMLPWLAFVLLLPWNEGSGSPGGLLVAHLGFLVAVAASRPRIRALPGALVTALLAVMAAAAISAAAGPYHYGSLLALIDLTVLMGVLVAGEAAVREQARLAVWLLRAIALSGLVQGAAVLAPWLASGCARRTPGTLLNPDHAAAYFLLCFCALVAARAWRGQRTDWARSAALGSWSRLAERAGRGWDRVGFTFLAGGLLLAAAVLQTSRGALVFVVVGGGTWLLLMGRALSARTRVIVGAAVLLLVMAAAAGVAHRFATREDPYAWDRLGIWGVSVRVTLAHPFLGAGPGLFPYLSTPFDLAHPERPAHYAKHVEATHSDLLRIVAETGLVGSVAFLVLAVVLARRGLRAVRSRGIGECVLAAGIAGLLAQALVENLSARPAVSYTGAMLVAILLGRQRRARAQGADDEGVSARTAGVSARTAGVSARTAGVSVRAPDRSTAELAPSPGAAGEGRAAEGPALGRSAPQRAGAKRAAAHSADAERRPYPEADEDEPAAAGSVSAAAAAGWPPAPRWASRVALATLFYGGLAWAALTLVIAPYLGYRSFRLFQERKAPLAAHYASAVFWNPIHPDYRAALAEAVLAGPSPKIEDLKAGFLALEQALALNPAAPRYYLLRARLARRAFLAGSGAADWIAMADEDYARAIALDPHRPQAHLERGWMHQDLGHFERAMVETEATLAWEPNSLEARRLRATALLGLGLVSAAREEAKEAARRRLALAGSVPADAYEEQILRWDEEGWKGIARTLEDQERSP